MDSSFQQYLDNLFPAPERQEEVRKVLYDAFGTMKSRKIGEEPIIHIHGPSNSGKTSFLTMLETAFYSPSLSKSRDVRQCVIVDIDSMMTQHKVSGDRNFLNLIDRDTADLRARWEWLVDLYKNEDDDDNHHLHIITTGSERRLDVSSTRDTTRDKNFFEYKSKFESDDWPHYPNQWKTRAPGECIKTRDTEDERTNIHYDTELICTCPDSRRGGRKYVPYERRLVDVCYSGNTLDLYPYFGHTESYGSYFVKEVVGVITVGYKPLLTSSTSRVVNIELTKTFTTDMNIAHDHRRKYVRKLRKWICSYGDE